MSKTESYKTRRRWSAEHARAALVAFEESGLSMAAFARREGFDPQRLRVWRARLGASEAQRVVNPRPTDFVEITARVSERVEIVMRSGHVVRVPAHFEASSLRVLLDVLAQLPAC